MDFDSAKSFDENLGAFRKELEAIDAECAALLFENLDDLLKGEPRDRAARGKFNRAVIASLTRLKPGPTTNGAGE